MEEISREVCGIRKIVIREGRNGSECCSKKKVIRSLNRKCVFSDINKLAKMVIYRSFVVDMNICVSYRGICS